MNVSDKVRSVIEHSVKDTCCQTEGLQDDDKLVKFFEILMQIDQRRKRDAKNN